LRRVQTDNAFTSVHNRSLRKPLADHGIQHRRIPPRTPTRNGKVERYQQTLAREWGLRAALPATPTPARKRCPSG
jgi:transposase InsO family protein